MADTPTGKNPLFSKTLIVNILAIIMGLAPQVQAIVPAPTMAKYGLPVLASVNLVLRILTKQPLSWNN